MPTNEFYTPHPFRVGGGGGNDSCQRAQSNVKKKQQFLASIYPAKRKLLANEPAVIRHYGSLGILKDIHHSRGGQRYKTRNVPSGIQNEAEKGGESWN